MYIQDDNEYGIILIKPDGVKANIIELLKSMLQKSNLTIIKTKQIYLKKEEVVANIVTKFDNEKYADYLSESEVIALLVFGQKAIATLIDIKQSIRALYGFSSDNMRNLLHSPDCGNEYFEHLKFLFPELNHVVYGTYGDLTVPAYGNEFDLIKELDYLNNISCVNWVGILINYQVKLPDLEEFILRKSNQINLLFGVCKKCIYKNEELQIIGYFHPNHKIPNRTDFVNNSIECYIHWIKEHQGVCVLDYRPFMDDSEKLITELKELGIDGVVVYDPRYTQMEVARLEVICEDDLGLLLLGGTNNIIPIGSLGVDKTTFLKFANKINLQL